MMTMRAAITSAIALSAVLTTPAHAREVDRREVAEEFAPDVPPERRVYCADTQVYTLTDGTQYRACVNWRAQSRSRLIRTYAALNGPENDTDANLDLARTCFDIAVASQNDPYRTAFDEDAFLKGARVEFARCATSRLLEKQNEYSLRVYSRGVWLG